MINCYGRKIIPEEIEEVILAFEEVREVKVYGVSEDNDDYICADIVPEKYNIDIDELRQFCKNKLASFKIPKKFNICHALEKTKNNKIKRN